MVAAAVEGWLSWLLLLPGSSFRWERGRTPGSSIQFLLLSSLAYPAAVLALQRLLRSRTRPLQLGPLPAMHNLILMVWSLVMFVGAAYAAWRDWTFTELVCVPKGVKPEGPLFFWAYIYYLSKFYEWLDTAVLLARKRPLTFLHVWHHTVVVAMAWLWVDAAQSLAIFGLLFNTFVHVIMYAYYFLTAIGRPPPWKVLVTNTQIFQFCTGFALSAPLLYLHFRPGSTGCEGMTAWLFNVLFNATLLTLFINFHRKTFKSKPKKSA